MKEITSVHEQQPESLTNTISELFVAIASLSIGGAERIVLDWASRIWPKWKVHLIVLHDKPQEWTVPDFVTVTRLHGKDFKTKLSLLGKQIAKTNNPVCVCHLLRKEHRDVLSKSGVRVVTVLHNAKEGWQENVSCLVGSSRIIGVSEACGNDLRTSGYEKPMTIIRHIPPKPMYRDDARTYYRNSWNVPENATVIGMIGSVKNQKNYPFAVKILAKLLETMNVYLVILGGPVDKHKGKEVWFSVMNEIQTLNVRHRISMPGFIENATGCLPAFDLLLNTSYYEGLSIATLEALISGLPVVASKVGGQGEITSEGLFLLEKNASLDEWVEVISKNIMVKFQVPSWSTFQSYRLWTLANIAYTARLKRNKMLFVTANLNSGGAQRSLVNLTKSIKGKIDFEVVMAGNNTSDYFTNDLTNSGIRVFRAGPSWNVFDYAENIVMKICQQGISTVCFWNVSAMVKLLVVKALESTNVKFIDVSPGDYIYGEMDDVAEFQQLISFSKQSYFKRINSFVLKFNGMIPEECTNKTHVIRNGIPEPKNLKTDYEIHGSPKVVVSGRIAPTKFIIEIIDAMDIVCEKIPNAELHIYGTAEYYHEDYAKQVYEYAATKSNKIVFHGQHFSVIDVLSEYDAYVVLGKNQGCPNALLEALSVGLPSIANDDGGTREQLIDGQTGILVKDCDPKELGNAIIKLLDDRKLAKTLGEYGRNHILDAFAMRKMKENYMSLFKPSIVSVITNYFKK